MSISIEEAVALALAHTGVLPEAQLPLPKALGLVLTRDVTAPIAQPPFDRSPLDGYAVRGADTVGATPENPAVLTVMDKVYAGQPALTPIGPGQAVRLMTGSMLPAGADAVIRQEDTDLGEDTVRIFRGLPAGSNCCCRGEEYGEGEVLLHAGQVVDAASVAVAAGAGLTTLPVRRRPRAAVISTGNELRQPGEPLSPGKIYDSNTPYLTARLAQLGVEVVEKRSACDDTGKIAEALADNAACDLILTTGGVSVGQKDLLEAAAETAGAEIIFHGIAIKPGMPTLLARMGNTLILGLSGNPFSAAVPSELLLHPMLAKLTGNSALDLRRASAVAANNFGKASPVRRFLRGRFDGKTVAIPTAQANGQMRAMIGCNCMIDLPAGSPAVQPGDPVDIILL